MLGYRALSLFGLFAMLGVAWALSVAPRRVALRPVLWGVALQAALAVLLLNPAFRGLFFDPINAAVAKLLSFSDEGARFVFKTLEPHQILGPDGVATLVDGEISPPVRSFAFQILPTIIFFSSLMSILYQLGLMQRVVWALGWLMQRTLGTSGAESLSAAANVFLGQTEAPLVVRPFVSTMTRSELCAVMTGGFATVSGGVLAAYTAYLKDVPGIAGHLVVASVLSAPAALAVAKVLVPETEVPVTRGRLELSDEREHGNALEAAAGGATQGMKLALNVAAMLIAFVGLVSLADFLLGLIPFWGGPLSLSRVLGWLMWPFALLMGVPFDETPVVAQLLGEKVVLTELIAYGHLGEQVTGRRLSERSAVIASYALCGFANFASIGIQLGGIGAMAPDRMRDLGALGLRTMVGGTLAAFMTACIAGVVA